LFSAILVFELDYPTLHARLSGFPKRAEEILPSCVYISSMQDTACQGVEIGKICIFLGEGVNLLKNSHIGYRRIALGAGFSVPSMNTILSSGGHWGDWRRI